ncbi:MAG: hypothetical protein ACUVQY_00365 [Thermoproteota archaeon]
MERNVIISFLLLVPVISIASIVLYAAVWKEDEACCAFGEAPYNIWVWAYVGGWSEGSYFSSVTYDWGHGDTSYQDWTADYSAEYGWELDGSGRIIKAWTYAEGFVYYPGAGPPIDHLQAYARIYP